MKNFSSRTRESSRPGFHSFRRWEPLAVVAGAFLALIFVRDILGVVASTVTAPFFYAKHYLETSADTVPTFVRSQVELMARIAELESALLGEEGRDSAYALLREENEELRNLLGGATGTPAVIAGVIARPPHTPYDTLLLDRGEAGGIVRDAPVYYGKGLALGYIREVFPRTALVTPFSSPGAEATVYVFGPDIFTTAHGEGGGVVRVSIPQGLPIAEGDLVVLPSVSAKILGTVEYVESVPTEPEQSAYVILDIPLQSIRVVAVGTNPVAPRSFPEALEAVEASRTSLFTVPVPEEFAPLATTSPALSPEPSAVEL